MTKPVISSDFPEIRWHGHWIWNQADKPPVGLGLPGQAAFERAEQHSLFRKSFSLTVVPDCVPARITADSRYVLFVNNQEVYRGPIRSQARRMMYDLFDLAPYLVAGENIIAVYVKTFSHANSYYIPPVPNSGLGRTGALVFEADLGQDGWLVSDDSWKAVKSYAWDFKFEDGSNFVSAGVPIEILDARQLPADWKEKDFNDADWETAQLLRGIHMGGFAHSQPPTDPYGPLYPRPIAKLGGEVVEPVKVRLAKLSESIDLSKGLPAGRVIDAVRKVSDWKDAVLPLSCEAGEELILVDIGRIVAGFTQLEVEAAPGTEIELCYVEELITGKEQGFSTPHNGSRYIARGENDRFEAFDVNGLRYIYIFAHSVKGPVKIKHVAVREFIYPWTEGASFECSDDELNAIFKAGVRTVNLNSHDAFLDCPTREQRAWVGDSVVHQMVHLTTNVDWRLAWQYLNLGNSPRYDGILPMSVAGEIEQSGAITIPDWSLHWVHGVYNLYRFVGDKDLVKSYMPVIERILRWYLPYQTSEGVLKDVVEWNLVDWASLFVEDKSSILTAVWARGLKEFSEMSAWLEEKSSQKWADGVYTKAKDGYEMFWDESRGSYVDHIKDGKQQKPMSQVAGAMAIVSGLAPENRWKTIIDAITNADTLVVRSWTGGGNGEYSMEKRRKQLMGIYEADWDVEKEVVIGEPFISYLVHDAVAEAGCANKLTELYRRWSEYLVGGYDTIGECWGWGTHVHGWSCTPTKDMIFYTLGVMPNKPGYAEARIAPRLGGLEWVKGKVPTPFGLLSVDVSADTIKIESPMPFVLDLEGKEPKSYPAGTYEI